MIAGIPMMNTQKNRKANSACHGSGEVKTLDGLITSLMSSTMFIVRNLLSFTSRNGKETA